MKLGLLPARPEQVAKVLRASSYLNASQLPTPPASTNNRASVTNWPMYANDRIGDCAPAAVAHMQQLWSAADSGKEVKPTETEVVAAYSAISGYDPRTGANDNGCVMLDVMEHWARKGIGPSKLDAYVAVDVKDDSAIVHACHLFGAVNIALNMPKAWEGADEWKAPISQFHRVGKWAPRSWGGHAVPIVDYDAENLYVCSWGRIIPMSWNAWHAYGSEAYACLDDLWWGSDGDDLAPTGFSLAQLKYDFAVLGGQNPPGPRPSPVTPVPPEEQQPVLDLGGIKLYMPARAGDLCSFGFSE